MVVGHPFSPVYLPPLCEVVGGEQTSMAAIRAAGAFYKRIGMRPLHVRNEIDAAITGGPGLRWAFMGMCLAWHLAGGPGGMRHTMAQFGPTLELPWTKLVPPKLTDELTRRIVEGSEEEAGEREFREMERRRDACLVGILEVLETHWYPHAEDGWPELDTGDA